MDQTTTNESPTEQKASSEAAVCAGCLNSIDEDEFVQALNQDWHVECFRCSACDAALSSWYFEKDGLLFCKDDYWSKYGESCQQCAQVITGPVMVAGDHKFHPECFSCSSCSAFIGDGEAYALVERSKLYCGVCYRRQMQPLSRGACPFSRKPHSIRLVEIPPLEGRKGLKLSSQAPRGLTISGEPFCEGLRISELDVTTDLMSLHIGDKILEVNGTPVNEQPLESIQNIIKYSDTTVQLTIEHDPDSLQRRIATVIPTTNLREKESRERLFKRRDEGYISASRSRQLRRSRGSSAKERSSSMSRLLEGSPTSAREPCELSRTQSFRVEPKTQRIFRGSDLVKGELLGKGFFGQVYKVTHRETGEVMVLKELYRLDQEAQRNFLKEVAVLRSLHHPNVLRFIGVLCKEKRLHLVTEFVSGGTLRQLLQDANECLPWSQRACFARDISKGMCYLHEKNIVHRDLNSHNCLVRQDRTVVVADFGLARIISQNASSQLWRNKRGGRRCERKKRYTVVGNPYWMAPEMMKGFKYDEKVDVFSFGIVLCEIIGRVHADPDYLPRSSDFGLNQSAFLDAFCSSCPECLYRIAFTCCDLNPDNRPGFDVLESHLEAVSMHLSVGVPLSSELHHHLLHCSGKSPGSSGNTTPEALASTQAPPLQPIKEGNTSLPRPPPSPPLETTAL